MKYNLYIKNNWLILLLVVILSGSCKKFIEVPPPTTSVTEANVFSNDQTATAVVTGLFSRISHGDGAYSSMLSPHLLSLSKLAGLSADELDLWSGAGEVERAYYENNLRSYFNAPGGEISAGMELWNWLYGMVYSANQTILNLKAAAGLTPGVKQQLVGECLFYRAFLYFYLTNLYGDVPLALSDEPESNRKLKQSPVSEVYAQIIADLTAAQDLLNANFVNSLLQPYGPTVAERTRPNRWAAKALLARCYLYTSQPAQATAAATEVISQVSLFDLPGVPLNGVFKKNSGEAIWQLQPVYNSWNTPIARMFVLAAVPTGFSTTKTVYLSASLSGAFEPGDARASQWVGSFTSTGPAGVFAFPFKYREATSNSAITSPAQMSEYIMMLRLAEQYLVRAEARAQTNDLSGAIADLNLIRTRARALPTVDEPNPLPNLPATLNQAQVLQAVAQERRVELFTEWGHRWLDLKRTGQVNTVMEPATLQKGGVWQSFKALYPIPARDLHYAPQLTQNPGY